MKRVICIVLVLSFAFSLLGSAEELSQAPSETSVEGSQEVVVTESTEETRNLEALSDSIEEAVSDETEDTTFSEAQISSEASTDDAVQDELSLPLGNPPEEDGASTENMDALLPSMDESMNEVVTEECVESDREALVSSEEEPANPETPQEDAEESALSDDAFTSAGEATEEVDESDEQYLPEADIDEEMIENEEGTENREEELSDTAELEETAEESTLTEENLPEYETLMDGEEIDETEMILEGGDSQTEERIDGAEAWYKDALGSVVSGSLREILEEAQDGAAIYILSRDILHVSVDGALLVSVSLLPDKDTFAGSFRVIISSSTDRAEELGRDALAESASSRLSVYIWVCDNAMSGDRSEENGSNEETVVQSIPSSSFIKTEENYIEMALGAVALDCSDTAAGNGLNEEPIAESEENLTAFAEVHQAGGIESLGAIIADTADVQATNEGEKEEAPEESDAAKEEETLAEDVLSASSCEEEMPQSVPEEETIEIPEEESASTENGEGEAVNSLEEEAMQDNAESSEEGDDQALNEAGDEGGEEVLNEEQTAAKSKSSVKKSTKSKASSAKSGKSASTTVQKDETENQVSFALPTNEVYLLTLGYETMGVYAVYTGENGQELQPITEEIVALQNTEESKAIYALRLFVSAADQGEYAWQVNGRALERLAESGISCLILSINEENVAIGTKDYLSGEVFSALVEQGHSKYDFSLVLTGNVVSGTVQNIDLAAVLGEQSWDLIHDNAVSGVQYVLSEVSDLLASSVYALL